MAPGSDSIPWMAQLVSVSLMVCERILQEQDGVMSAIRITDSFSVSKIPQLEFSDMIIPICVVASGRILENDNEEHLVQLKLSRPSGDTAPGENPKRWNSQHRKASRRGSIWEFRSGCMSRNSERIGSL